MSKAKVAGIIAIVLVIIGMIVAFTIVGNTSTDLISAANSVTDANNCSEHTDAASTAWSYNQTSKNCYNSTGQEQTALQYDLPLNTLFGASGVLYLVLMAFLFIGMVGFIIFKTRFKK